MNFKRILSNPKQPTVDDRCASCKRKFVSGDIAISGKRAVELLNHFELFKDCLRKNTKVYLHEKPCAEELRSKVPVEKTEDPFAKLTAMEKRFELTMAMGLLAPILGGLVYLAFVDPILVVVLMTLFVPIGPFVGLKLVDRYFDSQ